MILGPYPAVVTSIHDGDTFHLDIDLGFGIHALKFVCRVYGINAPELSTEAGKAALAYLESIMPVGSSVMVTSHSWDKYGGRFDGECSYNGLDIGQAMIASGNAVPMKA